MVTNHIYNSNVGVVGQVSGDATNSHFTTNNGQMDQKKLIELVGQIREASGGLPNDVREKLASPVRDLEASTKNGDKRGVAIALKSVRTVLEGAAGSLAA
ncbi:hypothetical protein ABG067_008526, partial [Albugo candida]